MNETARNPALAVITADNQCEYRGLGPPLTPAAAGQRLDLFLARHFPFRSRREWKAECIRGHLMVNGRAARPTYRLKNRDCLAVFHPLASEPEVDRGVALLCESAGVMAVLKPANLPMHESGYYRRQTLAALIVQEFGREWAPVHRLDRETSGIVICAATSVLRRRLSLDFETRAVAKQYLAIVNHRVPWDTLLVNQPLAVQMTDRLPRMVVASDGAESSTFFQVLERKGTASLIAAKPRTGRANQIRVHAAWAGHPLIGDKLYQPDPAIYDAYYRLGDTAAVQELAGFKRHALHAASICFSHPSTRNEFSANAPWPADLKDLWLRL